ncbi:MAG: tetratricopeptide (TPR) repeat protein [Myxococcota bacterium]|jgi:tetratricopeptide (TPR) repeat protein
MSSEDKSPKNPFEGFRVQIDPEKIEETLTGIRDRASAAFQDGRYTKVRLSYKGKTLLPDIPLAIFLATEGVAFWLVSPLPTLLVNLGAKAFLDVEFIHQADELVREGLALYLDGEVDQAEAKYRRALDRRPDDCSAHYNLGTLLRVTGRADEARASLQRAAMGPEGHPDVVRASEALSRMDGLRTL